MNRAIANAVNAIRECVAAEHKDGVDGLAHFCAENGLDKKTLKEFVDGPTDIDQGRIHAYFVRKEAVEKAEAEAEEKEKASKKKTTKKAK